MGGGIVAIEQDIQSGDRLDRPGLWRAIDRVQADAANAVIVYALDRLGRDSVQQGVVLHTLRGAGGQLFSATEDLQTRGDGRLPASAATFAAAVELEKVRERTNRGLDAKFRQSGRYKPGKRPPTATARSARGRAPRMRSSQLKPLSSGASSRSGRREPACAASQSDSTDDGIL